MTQGGSLLGVDRDHDRRYFPSCKPDAIEQPNPQHKSRARRAFIILFASEAAVPCARSMLLLRSPVRGGVTPTKGEELGGVPIVQNRAHVWRD